MSDLTISLKKNNDENSENLNKLTISKSRINAIEAWCEFVFVTLHRASLYCDVGEILNIKIIIFSE